MRIWTVHAPPAAASPKAEKPVLLIPERFSWLAFLFGLPWLLWHRLWLEAALYLGLVLVLGALLPALILPPAMLAVEFLLGAEAQDLRRAALARRGWRLTEVVAAPDADQALARLLDARPDFAPALVRSATA